MCPDKREKAPHVRLLASLINSQVLFWQKKKKRLLIAVEPGHVVQIGIRFSRYT